jgi:hypothetical protein
MKKQAFCNSKKGIFCTVLSGLLLPLCISKMICRAWEVLLEHLKSLKMEKNWERFAKVIGDRLVIGDEPTYLTRNQS